ncbi:MAG TPA: hypothetical protein VK610_00910 [Rhodothermales bacterium]|nr:hypothetical protein [Rhodothermales bacterium]
MPLRSLTWALLGLGAVLVAGCTSTAETAAPSTPTVDGAAVARSIVLCTTTEADLRRQLGIPTRDGLLRGDRIVSWIIGEDDVVQYLAVLLDARGVVVDLYWNLPTEIPWAPDNQCD